MSNDVEIIDRLYSTYQAGQLLGGLTPEAVCQLAKDGKLETVPQVVRGKDKKPRQYVRASELRRYMASLRRIDKTRSKRGKRIARPDIAKELAEAPHYL